MFSFKIEQIERFVFYHKTEKNDAVRVLQNTISAEKYIIVIKKIRFTLYL